MTTKAQINGAEYKVINERKKERKGKMRDKEIGLSIVLVFWAKAAQ